jgi:hypothetical protein
MEYLLSAIKNGRPVGIVLAVFIIGGMYGFTWADERFAKKEELHQLQRTVETGFESIKIEGASQEIRDVKLSKQIAIATGAPPESLEAIEDQLEHARAYKQCLVERGSNCEHIRDVE